MSRQGKQRSTTAEDWSRRILASRGQQNRSMTTFPAGSGGLRVSVPMKKPRWLVPPLSWIFPFSSERVVELDRLGAEVLEMCDGRQTVEAMIEKFAHDHRLSFREAQVSVLEFLGQLTQRGLVVIVGPNEDDTA